MDMQVILNEDIPSLGKTGDVVRVSPGFGRNFLLPRKKASIATAGNLKLLEQQRQSIDNKREKAKKEAEEYGQKITAVTLLLEKQAGEEDKIFGSISTREISTALEAQGFKVDKRLIRIKDAIRTLGEHSVEVHLHGDVVVPLKIQITKK